MEQSVKEVQVIEFGKIGVKEMQPPSQALGKDELLVAVHAAPFNPAEYYMVNGHDLFRKDPPFRLGLEGFGVIEAAGAGVDKSLVGRHCLFMSFKGTYGNRVVLLRSEVYVLDKDINLEAVKENFVVNPLTAYGMIQMAKEKQAGAIIQTAASSNVGKWITALAKQVGIKSIAVIRSEKHVKELTDLGADVVLNSTDENYTDSLKKAIDELKPTMLFDALGGDKPVAIFAQMPPGSTLVCHGMMESNELVGLSITHMLGAKNVTMYALGLDTLPKISHENLEKIVNDMYRDKLVVHEPVQDVGLEQAPDLVDMWKTRQARLVLTF